MLRGIFILIILIFLILSMLPIFQFATDKHERRDLRIGAAPDNTRVNIFDYNVIVTQLGKEGKEIRGDINNDGKVDLVDFNIILSRFGNKK